MVRSRKSVFVDFDHNIRIVDDTNYFFLGPNINQNLENPNTKKIDMLINDIDDILNA